jgi:two-component system cell cycle response regulator
MNDQRTILALVAGGGGLALGIAGAAADVPVLGAVAGGLALVVAFLVVRSVQDGGSTREEAAKLSGQVAELETALAMQVQSRLGAEEAVRSLGAQLAAAQRDANKPTPIPTGGAEAITDAVTGLFSEDYFRVAVDARIAAARRHLRPVAVVLLEVIEGLRTATPQTADPVLVSDTINVTLREADTACRMLDGRFGLVLEDTSENGAIWTVERIRRSVVELQQGLTLRAGIACYPAHAFGSTELLQRSTEALMAARDWNQDRIEVASAE